MIITTHLINILLIIFAAIALESSAIARNDGSLLEEFSALSDDLEKRLPAEHSPSLDIDEIKNIRNIDSKYSRAADIVVTLADSTSCSDDLLAALESASNGTRSYRSINNTKNPSRVFQLLANYVEVVAPKCIVRFSKEAQDLKLHVDGKLVGKFYQVMMADDLSKHWEEFAKCLFGRCDHLNAPDWLVSQTMEMGLLDYETSRNLYNLSPEGRKELFRQFSRMYRKKMVKPCGHMISIYGEMLKKFDNFLRRGLNHFLPNNGRRFLDKALPELKEALYLYKACSFINKQNTNESLMDLFNWSIELQSSSELDELEASDTSL